MSSVERAASLSPATSACERVTFTAPGVAAKIGDEGEEITFVGGLLQLVEKPFGVFIEWTPSENPDDASNEWVLTPSPPKSASSTAPTPAPPSPTSVHSELLKQLRISVDVADLVSFVCHESRPKKAPKGPFSPWIRLMGKDGTNFVPLYFRDGGVGEFIAALQRYASLKRSAKDNNLILMADEKADALAESVSLLFAQGGQGNTGGHQFLNKLMSNPYATAMTGLGKVTHFLNDNIGPLLLEQDGVSNEEAQAQLDELLNRAKAETEDLRTHGAEAGFELVTQLELPPRPSIDRSNEAAVDRTVLETFREPFTGRLERVRELQLLIFRGGIVPELRAELWKYQLGVWEWDWGSEEKEVWRRKATDDYFRMKLQWRSMSEAQIDKFADFAERKALIEKDVARTDRTHSAFQGSDNANLDLLRDILMTYVMHNFDLGYVQGMSDLLSPLLVVMGNEVEAFWAFDGYMRRVHSNFSMDQAAIKRQLMHLRDLLMLVSPRLANYLEAQGADNMYFTFRWLLVLFKREFSFPAIQRLWEILWTDLPCRNFHLLFCVSLLDAQTNTIIEAGFGFTEILKHINDMSGHIDLTQALEGAEGIFHQLAATQDKLPDHINSILGFQAEPSSPAKTPSKSPSP